MKTFRVGVWETIGGYVELEAKDIDDAEKQIIGAIEEFGLEQVKGFDITHREFQIFETEEME